MEKKKPKIHLILASKSRDRRRLLELAKIPVEVIPSNFNEDLIQESDPYAKVQKIARAKALKSYELWKKENQPNSSKSTVVIAADTMVLFDGELIGKAKTKEDAHRILTLLAGKIHHLLTGVAIKHSKRKKIFTFVDDSLVHFQQMNKKEISTYLKDPEYRGRAGAYSLREKASLFIDRIEGSPSNVLGLPMAKLRTALKTMGIDLLDL